MITISPALLYGDSNCHMGTTSFILESIYKYALQYDVGLILSLHVCVSGESIINLTDSQTGSVMPMSTVVRLGTISYFPSPNAGKQPRIEVGKSQEGGVVYKSNSWEDKPWKKGYVSVKH